MVKIYTAEFTRNHTRLPRIFFLVSSFDFCSQIHSEFLSFPHILRCAHLLCGINLVDVLRSTYRNFFLFEIVADGEFKDNTSQIASIAK